MTAWYFAYGSNMETATFRGRRNIEFLRALPARADGWRLVLDKPPLVPGGAASANIVAVPGATVLGVLYEIPEADLGHLDLTEGVLVGNYRRIVIPVSPLMALSDAVDAFTLVSDRRDTTLRPSHRYMARLITGAGEHALPPDWIAFLRAIPAVEESDAEKRFRSVVDDVLRKPSEAPLIHATRRTLPGSSRFHSS